MIRERVSDILDVPIRAGRWVSYTESLDREGRFDRRKMLDIIMALCEQLEQAELRLERLAGQFEDLPSPPTATLVTAFSTPPETLKVDATTNVTESSPDPTVTLALESEATETKEVKNAKTSRRA